MKRRILSIVLLICLLLTAMPVQAQAASVRAPIYLGVLEADYMAEQILSEIPTDGLSAENQILAVYDWIIEHCVRNGWDGQFYFDESAVALASHSAFAAWYHQQVQTGQILVRRDLKEESGTPAGFYDYTSFVMDSNANVGSYAYEMMLKRTGNCAHYAALFALLLSHLGFDSRMIHGQFINRDGSTAEHTWNYVLVDGTYYWFDIRIDDELAATYQITEHSYFMQADTAVWAREHNFDPAYSDWLAANAPAIQADLDLAAENLVGPWDLCSDWARDYMRRAGNAGLIPSALDNQDLTLEITRAEFAAVAVRLYEAFTWEVPAYQGESPFSDTDDPDVLRAYSLGVVNGMGDGIYAPDDNLTREQAVTMLGRVYELALTNAISGGASLPESSPLFFRDRDQIAEYAAVYVAFFVDRSIIDGMGDNTFAPKNFMTREQAIKITVEAAQRLS